MTMDDLREKVINGLYICSEDDPDCQNCPYYGEYGDGFGCETIMQRDALSLLKAQELPDVKPEKLEERTTKWLDQMTAEERLEEIAAILDDWDGYRTAKGLAGLINEVWAYALYPVKEESKNHQAKKVTNIHIIIDGALEGRCPCCGSMVVTGNNHITKFCKYCGQAVKWE